MPMLARTPAQVIAAEAAYNGSDETRFADMLGIASVVANRALMTGVTPAQVVGVRSQFNAYGKAMPPGAQRYVDMAQAAIDDVEQNGPVNTATYYATPAAVGNLPGGLEQVDQTEQGHIYYSDPLSRPIKTTLGTMAVDPNALDQQISTMAAAYAATPEDKPTQVADAGFDMSRFGDVATPDTANFDTGRFGTAPAAMDMSRMAMTPSAGLDMAQANTLSGNPAMGAPMSAAGALGIGGALPDAGAVAGAMDASSFADRFGEPGMGTPDSVSSMNDPSAKMDRLPGMNTPASFDTSRYNDPTFDASRMAQDPNASLSAAIADAVANNPALGANVTATGDVGVGAPGQDMASAVANVTQSAPAASQSATATTPGLNTPEGMKAQYAAYGAGQITPDEAAAAALGAEINSTKYDRPTAVDAANAVPGITDDVTAPVSTTISNDDVTTAPVTVTAPAVVQARPTVAATKTIAAAPQMATAGQVWSGEAQTGVATDGSTVSRMSDGTIGRYNPTYDHTEYTNSDGSYGGIEQGNTLGTSPAAKALEASSASKSLTGAAAPSLSSAASTMGNSIFSGGTLGSMLGAVAGAALGGPIGGTLGATAGRQLGGKYLGDGIPDESPLKSLFSIFSPAVTVDAKGFPSKPSPPGGLFGGMFGNTGQGGLNSYGNQVASQSGQFDHAVDSGTGGLW